MNKVNSKFWERTEGEVVVRGSFTVEYPGNRSKDKRFAQQPTTTQAPSPLDLPSNYYACVHVETVLNQADGTVDHVRCGKDSAVGFLCAAHDHSLLDKKVERDSIKISRDTVNSILKAEERAMRDKDVEVAGCGRLTIKFVKDYVLHNVLDNILGELFLDTYEFGFLTTEDAALFED